MLRQTLMFETSLLVCQSLSELPLLASMKLGAAEPTKLQVALGVLGDAVLGDAVLVPVVPEVLLVILVRTGTGRQQYQPSMMPSDS
jgi:hypothetical protein